MSLVDRKLTKNLSKLESNTLNITYTDRFKSICELFCSVNPTKEWSGVLFYKILKSLNNNIEIELLDIQLMDIGTSGFTQYAFDGSIGELALKYNIFDETSGVHMGHIHSHNKMGVFFSGTDNQELIDNSENHFLYLSVIVNNNLDIIARAIIKEEVTLDIQSKGSILFKDATKEIKYPKTQETYTNLWFYEAEFKFINNNTVFTTEELKFYYSSLTTVIEKESSKYRTAKQKVTTTSKIKEVGCQQSLFKPDIPMSPDYTLIKELLIDATNLVGKNQNSITPNVTMAINSELSTSAIAQKIVNSLVDLLQFNNTENMYESLNIAKRLINNHLGVYPKLRDLIYKAIDNAIEDQDTNINSLLSSIGSTTADITDFEMWE